MKAWGKRLAWMAVGIGGLYAISALAGVASGGSLDPPGTPASTMQTLADLVPSWHKTLSSSGGCTSARFSCVMGGNAVLDAETGLVWERTPTNGAPSSWDLSTTVCTSLQTGGRFGWRMPTAEELLSVKDPAQFDGLPPGHPFTGVSGNTFWTATSDPLDPGKARWISISQLVGNEQTASKARYNLAGAWCVRGGSGFDAAPHDLGSWSQTLAANDGFDSCSSSRFTCVLGNAAVLDHETGLVWQRSPVDVVLSWDQAYQSCQETVVGTRRGWRLPSIEEFNSLAEGDALPTGHPFIGGHFSSLDTYWSSTAAPNGYIWSAHPGDLSSAAQAHRSLLPGERFWCVRGPERTSPQVQN